MQIDFALALVLAALVTGVVYLLDVVVLGPRRSTAATVGRPAPMPWYVDWSRSFFPVIVIVLLLRSFVVEPFRIPSGSMLPTLQSGDFILVSKFAWGLRLPVLNNKIIETGSVQRGDIAVFRYPEDPSVAYIKRIVGLPGDHIVYRDKTLYVNGQVYAQGPLATPVTGIEPGFEARAERIGELTHAIQVYRNHQEPPREFVVPAGHYWAMGDNRDNSRDSRFWGPLPEGNLIGKAFLIWMNWDCVTGKGHCGRIGTLIE